MSKFGCKGQIFDFNGWVAKFLILQSFCKGCFIVLLRLLGLAVYLLVDDWGEQAVEIYQGFARCSTG